MIRLTDNSRCSTAQPLLDRIELSEDLVTPDALHTQRQHCHYLTGRTGTSLCSTALLRQGQR